MPSQAIIDFNASKDPNKKLSDFTKPPVSGSAPITSAPTPSPQPLSRDFNREQAVIQKLNINPSQLAMLDPKTLMERTYTQDELKNIPDYNVIQQYQQTTKPTNATMGILEQALRAKSDPGQQALGQSQGMQNAGLQMEGVGGHAGLFTSLTARANEMRSNFDSFSTGIANTGRGMLAAYQPLAARYKDINDQFNKGMEFIQKLDEAAKAHEYSMDQINQQFENSKKMEAYKFQLEQGNAEGDRTGPSVDTSNMDTTEGKFADNCILNLRQDVKNLPYGLYTKADKRNAIMQFGVQNQGGNSMDGIKIGDAILTSEGDSGHGARVINIITNSKGEKVLQLHEANYVAGKVTEGRTISINDPKIYGYIANNGKEAPQVQGEAAQIESTQILEEGKAPGVFESEEEAKTGASGKPDSMKNLEIDSIVTEAFGKLALGKKNVRKDVADAYAQMGYDKNKTLDYLRTSGKSEAFVGDYRDAAESIAFKLPAEKASSFQNSLDRSLEEGNEKRAKSLIKEAARSTLDSASEQQLRGYDTTLNLVDSIKSDLQAYEAKGGDTGFFKGNIEKLAQKVGQTSDKDLAKLQTKIIMALQNYRRSMTGVAFSEKESAEYKSIFPSIDSVRDFNTAKISALGEVFKTNSDSMYSQVLGEDTYNRLFNSDQSQSGMTTFVDSEGQQHTIPTSNMEKAKQMDPGLKIIK